jgi:hypothetical protein
MEGGRQGYQERKMRKREKGTRNDSKERTREVE